MIDFNSIKTKNEQLLSVRNIASSIWSFMTELKRQCLTLRRVVNVNIAPRSIAFFDKKNIKTDLEMSKLQQGTACPPFFCHPDWLLLEL